MLDEKLFGLLDGIKETDPNTGVRAFSPGLVQYEQNATKELLAARDVFDLKMEESGGESELMKIQIGEESENNV